MWRMLWAISAASAGPVDDARAHLEQGWAEAAVTVLDPYLWQSADAALLRFELAEQLEDPGALQDVLTPDVVERLPWSTRDRAHLLLATRDLQAGRIAAARRHLEVVYPDSAAWGRARLLAGDLALADGQPRSAVYHWREAVEHGESGLGLLRIAETYEKLGRPADAVGYLEMIPDGTPAWWQSRIPLARDLLAIGSEGEAMAVLVALAEPEVQIDLWTPELEFLRAEAWEQRCQYAKATEIRLSARQALRPVFEATEIPPESTPEALWATYVGEGSPMPAPWVRTFLAGRDVQPLVDRVKRIDAELAPIALAGHDDLVAILVGRRAATVRQLGLRLQVALVRERNRLAPWLFGKAEQEGLVAATPNEDHERHVPARRRRPFRIQDSSVSWGRARCK